MRVMVVVVPVVPGTSTFMGLTLSLVAIWQFRPSLLLLLFLSFLGLFWHDVRPPAAEVVSCAVAV